MAITLFDISTRPMAPKIEGVTELQRLQGRRLARIHAMYLAEISEVEALVRRIDATAEDDAPEFDQLGEALSRLQLASNLRDFGNLCGRQCQLLTVHHTIEDRHLFPALLNRSEGLDAVVRRLQQEHRVIHRLINEMQGQALDLIANPDREDYLQLKQNFATLAEIIRSHFFYEENELEEALGHYEIMA